MALKDGILKLLEAFCQAFDAMEGSHDHIDEPQALVEHHCSHLQAAEATAGNVSNEIFFRAKRAIRILGVYIEPNSTLTANDTNYKTVSLKKADGAAGSETTCASANTKTSGSGGTGDWADKTAIALTLSATDANRNLAAGEHLLLDIAAAASGVATPQFTMHVDYKLL